MQVWSIEYAGWIFLNLKYSIKLTVVDWVNCFDLVNYGGIIAIRSSTVLWLSMVTKLKIYVLGKDDEAIILIRFL